MPVHDQDSSPAPSSAPRPISAPDTFPSLLFPEPIPRPDLLELRQGLSFAFSSGVSGGLFNQALERAPMAPSTWDPRSFAPDLFLEELVSRCFRVRVSGHEALIHRSFVLRVLSHPPSDTRTIELRRGILRELSASPVYRQQLEQLYASSVRLRAALEASGFTWLGAKDRVHFDYRGRGASSRTGVDVMAFQQLWNRNHPEDPISATGRYNAATEVRLKSAPSAGFPVGAGCGQAPSREKSPGPDE